MVTETVAAALEDRPIEGLRCLEAGAGVGNTTAGLLEADASEVLAVTKDREHARTVREQVDPENADRLRTLQADLRAIPLPANAVEVVTAHALCNVLPTTDMGHVASELTRVASPGAHLLVDDYAPLPADASIRALFALENAAVELAENRPALTFYPEDVLRGVFASHGWVFDRRKTLLDPVPWTASHVAAHVDVVRAAATEIGDDLGDALVARAEHIAGTIGSASSDSETIGSESVGEMYSLAFRLPA